MRWWLIGPACLGTLVVVLALPAGADTLEQRFGDGAASGCLQEGTPIEQRILDRGSGDYEDPAPAVTASLIAAIDAVVDRDLALAQAEAFAAGYQLTPFFDDDRQRWFRILEPIGPDNPGHGYFIFDSQGNRSVLVEAPHVGFDTRSVDFGIQILDTSRAFALLIPGADRYANYTCDGCARPCNLMPGKDDSDVTRTETSLFHQVHKRLLDRMIQACRRPLVLQVHGFGTTTQMEPGCGVGFVLSDGDAAHVVDPHLTALGMYLEAHTLDGSGDPEDAYTWNVASGVGNDCSQLLATLNRQGLSTRAAGARFAHVEMDSVVRAWPDASDALEVAASVAESRLGAYELTLDRGLGDEVVLHWTGWLGDEIVYRSSSAADFCGKSVTIPAPAGQLIDDPGLGAWFYRVE